MSLDENELEARAADLGGVFDHNTLGRPFSRIASEPVDTASAFVDGLRVHMEPPWKTRPLHTRLTNARWINARATKGKSADYIFVTMGAVEKVFGTMYGLLALPTFLPYLGNSNAEAAVPIDPRKGFPPLPFPLPQGDAPLDVRLPSDPARVSFAMQLATSALSFLGLHEVGHLIAGHLDMREQHGAIGALAEFDAPEVAVEGLPPARVFETDADAFAAHATSFLDMHPNMTAMSAETFEWKASHPGDLGFIIHAVAISVLFRILRGTKEITEPSGPMAYPHPAVRANVAISRSFALCLASGRFTSDELPRLLQRSLLHVEETWASLGFTDKHFDPRTGQALTISRLSDSLSTEYESWKPVLTKHARAKPRWHSDWPEFPPPDASQ